MHREAVGERFSLPAMVKARDLTFEGVRRIGAALRPGVTEGRAHEIAQEILEAMGMERLWHKNLIRFGPGTLPDRPDAVFCASDQMAIAAMDEARFTHRLRIPEDLSIIGFDDAPPAAWPSYALTTYSQPIVPMVDATVALILERLADPAIPPRRVIVPGHLVLRGSCRLPPEPTP